MPECLNTNWLYLKPGAGSVKPVSNMKITAVWDMTPWNLVPENRRKVLPWSSTTQILSESFAEVFVSSAILHGVKFLKGFVDSGYFNPHSCKCITVNPRTTARSVSLIWSVLTPMTTGIMIYTEKSCGMKQTTLATQSLRKKVKAIPVTGHGGLLGCEMLRIPHCLDNRLTVNCEILATCRKYLQSSSYLTGSTLRLHKVKLSP
jgi:hypothetical protein